MHLTAYFCSRILQEAILPKSDKSMYEEDELVAADRGSKKTRHVHVARVRYGPLVQRQGKPARGRVEKSSNLFCRFTNRID